MRKSGTIGVLAALVASILTAQGWRGSEVVEVRVSDAKGRSVEGARVTFTFQGVPGKIGPPIVGTDAKGRAVLADLAPGPWQVDVEHPDYLTYVAMVDLRRGKKPLVSASFLEAGGRSLSPLRVKFSKGDVDEASPALEARRPPPPPAGETAPAPVAQPERPQPSERVAETEAPEPEAASSAVIAKAEASEEPTPTPPAPAEEPAATTADVAPPLEEPADLDEAPEPSAQPIAPAEEPAATTADVAPPLEEPADLDEAPEPSAEPIAPAEEPAVTTADVAPLLEEPAELEETAESSAPQLVPIEDSDATPVEVEARDADSAQEPMQTPREPAPLPVIPAEPSPIEEPPPPAEVPVQAEPEAESPSAIPEPPLAQPSSQVPLPPEDALPAPADPGIVVTSFRDGSCPDCQTAEWSVATSAPVAAAAPDATGSCGAEVIEAARSAMDGLATSIQLELARFIGPVADGSSRQAIDRLETDLAEPFLGPLAPFVGGATSCQIVGVVIPKSLRYSRVRLTATGQQGTSECAPGQDCPIGEARWIGGARVIEGPSATVIYGVFENRATDRGRRAGVTVYFRPPNANWRPSLPAGP